MIPFDKRYRLKSMLLMVLLLPSMLILVGTAGCNEDTAQGHLSSGYQLLEKGFDDRAIEQFTKSMKYDDSLAGAYAWRGVAYTHIQEFELAVPDFTRALRLDDELDWIYAWRATAYAETQQWDEAIQDADQAISLDPSADRAYRARAMARMAQGDTDRAISDFLSVIAVSANEDWVQQAREALLQLETQED